MRYKKKRFLKILVEREKKNKITLQHHDPRNDYTYHIANHLYIDPFDQLQKQKASNDLEGKSTTFVWIFFFLFFLELKKTRNNKLEYNFSVCF